jgi:excisionase family DNA binding protein
MNGRTTTSTFTAAPPLGRTVGTDTLANAVPNRRSARRRNRATSATSVDQCNSADEHLLDVHAAAAFLGVAPRTLYKWGARGRLPVVHLGRAVRFRMSALRALVRENEEPAAVPLGGAADQFVGAGTERAAPTRS